MGFIVGLAVGGISCWCNASLELPTESVLPPALPLTLADGVGGNPADVSHREATESTTQPSGPALAPFTPVHSWQLPPVTVVGERPSELREEDRIGSYAQPRWTADRRFSETRIYVIPEGKVEFEYWLVAEAPHHGPTEVKHMFELEFGLPSRFQVDLYLIDRKEGSGGQSFIDGQFEIRYALADWGKIWGNPTLYLEYKAIDSAPDEIEAKLLLGGEIAPRWHWGANLVWDAQTGGDRETSYEFTNGVSYTFLDERFSLGVETQLALIDVHNHRGTYDTEFFIGPSVQYRPAANIHLDFAPLIGVADRSAFKGFFIFGYEF